MATPLLKEVFTPSGIRAGDDLSQPLRDVLSSHAGVPHYQSLIEEGTYDDFKACVFRACAHRAYEVCLGDMRLDLSGRRIEFDFHQRCWCYGQHNRCVTTVEARLVFCASERLNSEKVTEFLADMAIKYGYSYNRLAVNHKAYTALSHRASRSHLTMLDPSVEVEMEIVWPFWM